VQVEQVSSQLWICAVKAFAASYKLDKQRDSTLNDILGFCGQGLVAGAPWGKSMQVAARSRSAQARKYAHVVAACCERATVSRERVSAFDVEAWVHEWAERQKS